MTVGYFEVSGAPSYLHGKIEASVYEIGGVAPKTIIRTDEDWVVRFCWELDGALKSMICGTWCLHVHLESIGKGPELDLPDDGPEVEVPLDPCGDGKYQKEFLIRAGTVKAEHCGTPYKMVATVTYRNACDLPGPMAGFVEGPILQFYDAGSKKP